jgi:hypothetical protein
MVGEANLEGAVDGREGKGEIAYERSTVKGGKGCCTRMFVQTRGGRVCGW